MLKFDDINVGDIVWVDLSKTYKYVGPAKIINKVGRFGNQYKDLLLPDFDVKLPIDIRHNYVSIYINDIQYKIKTTEV